MTQAATRKLLALALIAVTVSLVGAAQKPVVDHPFRSEERGGVGSLTALWNASDIVVEGVIQNDRPADYGTAPLRVNTMFDFQITEVFKRKDGIGPGTTIAVRRAGGRRDVGDKVENYFQEGYPLFQQGERYILFLTRYEWVPPAPHTGIYYAEATKTADSTFRIDADSQISGSGKAKLSESIRATPMGTLRNNLRLMAGAK